MNFLRLSFFLMFIVALSSCNKDDDDGAATCAQSDWVGTYSGTMECDGASEDVTITITASGTDDIIVKYETTTVSAEYSPTTPSNCNLDFSGTDQGVTVTLDASLDGDKLEMEESFSAAGTTSICNLSATRD